MALDGHPESLSASTLTLVVSIGISFGGILLFPSKRMAVAAFLLFLWHHNLVSVSVSYSQMDFWAFGGIDWAMTNGQFST